MDQTEDGRSRRRTADPAEKPPNEALMNALLVPAAILAIPASGYAEAALFMLMAAVLEVQARTREERIRLAQAALIMGIESLTGWGILMMPAAFLAAWGIAASFRRSLYEVREAERRSRENRRKTPGEED